MLHAGTIFFPHENMHAISVPILVAHIYSQAVHSLFAVFEQIFTFQSKLILNVLFIRLKTSKNISKKSLFHVSISTYKEGSFKKIFDGLLIAPI
jgi:hypothetical protein